MLEPPRPMVIAIAVTNKLVQIVWAKMTTENSIGQSSWLTFPRLLATLWCEGK